MKIRESGMPEENLWESLFDVPRIISKMEINASIHDLVEIGFGFGTFTLPAAQRIRGTVFAYDIEPDNQYLVNRKLESRNINNVDLQISDVIDHTTGLEESSVDYVMLFNILHHDKPEILLDEAHRILKTNGKVGIIHWRSDIDTPRGPSLEIRPTPKQILNTVDNAKFQIYKKSFHLEPYRYGLILSKL